MKKTIAVFILAGVCALMNASPVNIDRAQGVAGKFLGGKTAYVPYAATKAASDWQSMYVFNSDKGGFVIVAGDDSVYPVIGYSKTSTFRPDNIPVNMREWLDMWDRVVRHCATNKIPATPRAAAGWAEIERGGARTASPSKLLETAQWNQGAPYNAMCPFYSSQTVTGCVATATAILMRYFKYPEKGVGTLPDYTYTSDEDGEKKTVKGVELGHVYDWDNMPLKYSGGESPESQKAVAQLMSDLGIMLEMQYGVKSSGTYTENVPRGLMTYMGYDKRAYYEYYQCYDYKEWTDKLKENIDTIGPVIYGGVSKDGGHCFIIDGYDTAGLMHINWGWGGSDNNYFGLPDNYDFTQNQLACFSVMPDAGGKAEPFCYVYDEGLTTDAERYQAGVPFNVQCKNLLFQYAPGTALSTNVACARVSRTGEIQEVHERSLITNPFLSGYLYTITFPGVSFSKINIGDCLMVAYKDAESDQWKLAHGNREHKSVFSIPLGDTETLHEVSTIRYSSSDKIVTVSTKEDASFVLKDPSGAEVTEGVSRDKGTITIESAKLVKGEYTITLKKEDDEKTLKIKMGGK